MTRVVNLEKIISGSNCRNEKDDLSELHNLAESINANGLLQPICVRPVGDKYEIILGHRRFEAVKLLGLPDIECNILSDVFDKDRLILQVVENTQRRNMSAYDLVNTFNEMKEKWHCKNGAIAHYFNKPEQWVNDQYCAVKILEREYKEGIPEEKKKQSAGVIKAELRKRRAGPSDVIECKGFNIRKKGHNYLIYCSTFEGESKLNDFINQNK